MTVATRIGLVDPAFRFYQNGILLRATFAVHFYQITIELNLWLRRNIACYAMADRQVLFENRDDATLCYMRFGQNSGMNTSLGRR